MSELDKVTRSSQMLGDIAKGILNCCPFGAKVAFMNCEFQNSEGGIAWSDDLFAIVKLPLAKAKRVKLEPSTEWQLKLMELGKQLVAAAGQPHLTLDLIVKPNGTFELFTSLAPLRRLTGVERGYRSKHKEYVEAEPLFALVD